MGLGSFVDRIVVINLDRRPDRWERCRTRLAAASLARCERFSAVDGRALDLAVRDRSFVHPAALAALGGPLREHVDMSIGAVGCFLSHLRVWSAISSDGVASRVLVFEDDAEPTEEFNAWSAEEQSTLLTRVPSDFDLLLLGCNVVGDLACPTMVPGVRRIFYFNATHSYVITRAAMGKLAPLLLPIRMHIDHQISRLLIARPEEIRAYALDRAWFTYTWPDESDVEEALVDEGHADRVLADCVAGARAALRVRYPIG
jgi:GR25 family glycosyltransferase involved in LPS biosynthesis